MKKIFTFFAALTCTASMFAATETVYFVNADKWTGTINAYAWEPQNANWPGVPATKEAEQLAGCDVYSYSAEAGTYANVIFNNGSKQTADLKWTAGKYYVRDGWYTQEEAEAKLSGSTPVDPKPQGAYYITGNDALFGANAWQSDAIAMTEAEGVYTHTFTAVAAGVECQFKITDGTWNNSWGFSNLTTTPAGVTGNKDNNIIFTLAETGDVVVSFSAEKITITGNFAGSSVDSAQITYALMGIQGDWTTGIELTKNEIAEWEEYMLLGQTISEGDSVKVVRLEAGVAKHWCGNVKEGVSVTITPDDKNGNIILAPGTYDFYYDVVADAIWIAEAVQSAIDNVVLENKATKIIRNGQMYIIRDEVMFNILGQVVE